MSLRYRDATMQDLPRIVEIYNSTVAGRMVTADTEPVSVYSREAWFEEHEPKNRPLWMVDKNDETIGWVSFQSFYGRPAYHATAEISIYLDEKIRGKGIGKQVLRYAMDAAPGFGIKTLLGFVFAHNEPSMRLFTQMGFAVWAHLPGIARLDDVERDLIILGNRINP